MTWKPHGEMHHNPAKNVLWIARSIAEVTQTIGGGMDDGQRSAQMLARAKGETAGGARGAARAVCGYDALRRVERDVCLGVSRCGGGAGRREGRGVPRLRAQDARSHAGGSLERRARISRIASEARASTARSTIRFLRASRCSTPTKRRSTGSISTPRGARRISPSPNILTPKAAAFSIAPRARRPWAGSKSAASRCRIRPRPARIRPRRFCSIACTVTPETRVTASSREATLEAFAGIAPQFGIHAASYGLAALLHARQPFEVVITGSSDDPQADALEQRREFRLPLRQGRAARHAGTHGGGDALAPALAETLPHLRADVAQALVCVGTSCRPPVSDPAALVALLTQKPAHAWRGLSENR